MRKFMKGSSLAFASCIAVILAALPCYLRAIHNQPGESLSGLMDARSLEQTAEQEPVYRCKFEDLSAEYQEQARRLGYKEGEMVEMRRDSTGALVIIPPLKESETPAQMREKLVNLIGDKIVQDESAELNIETMLALDGTGHFTIRLKFEAVKEELQMQARKLGFKQGDTVEVQVDAVTWNYRVLPKEKETKFGGYVQEIIQPEEPGGALSYRMIADYSALPKDLQKRAQKRGYGKKDAVRFIYREGTKEYEILPPPFKFGIRFSFNALDNEEQAKALRLGYKEGDTVWKTFDSKWNTTLVSAAKAGSGPLMEVSEDVLIEQEPATGALRPLLQCVARFEVLSSEVQQQARQKGYKEGDKVQLHYDIRAGRFEIIEAR